MYAGLVVFVSAVALTSGTSYYYGVVPRHHVDYVFDLDRASGEEIDPGEPVIKEDLNFTWDWRTYFSESVFPQIDGYNISQECYDAWNAIYKAENNNKFWDSFGVVGSGLLDGNTYYLGSSQECANSKQPDYKVSSPFPDVSPRIVTYYGRKKTIYHAAFKMHLGFCAPVACTNNDMYEIIYNKYHHGPKRAPPYMGSVYGKSGIDYTPGFIIGIVIFSILTAVVISATVVEIGLDILIHYLVTKELQQNSLAAVYEPIQDKSLTQNGTVANEGNSGVPSDASIEQTGIKPHKPDLRKTMSAATRLAIMKKAPQLKYLLCFSFIGNIYKLLSTSEVESGQLGCLNGIRVMSLGWVCLGHTYLFLLSVMDNPLYLLQDARSFFYQTILNATPSVDSFFVLSGLLVMYNTLKGLEAHDVYNAKFWAMFIIRRFIRLWPALILMILFTFSFYQIWGANYYTPQWHPGFLIDMCTGTKWMRTAFFMNDILWDDGNTCIGWTWYLSNDIKFFLISPIFIILIKKNEWVGRLAISALILSSSLVCIIMTAVENLPPASTGSPLDSNDRVLRQNYNTDPFWTNQLYYKPYSRFMSYGAGLIVGQIIYQHKKLDLKPMVITFLYVTSIIFAGFSIYGCYPSVQGHPMGPGATALYNGFFRLMWSIALDILIVLCHYGYGWVINDMLSAKFWVPLARVTYVAYLFHIFCISGYTQGLEVPFHYTVSNLTLTFTGMIVCVYFISVPLSCFIEAPFIRLEKMIFGR